MQISRKQKWLMTGSVCVGLAVGAAGMAGAASTGSTATTTGGSGSSTAAPAAPLDPATVDHGPGETLLTGDTATKVKAAAEAAVPGGTVIRVETDNDGSAYEAHVKKADGTCVTVKVDSSFKVTSTEEGFGPGPRGGHPPASTGDTSQ